MMSVRVGVGVGGSDGGSGHSHHPQPFSSFVQPTHPPPLSSPLHSYASPSLYPLPATHWPASFPHCLFDPYSPLAPLTSAFPHSAAALPAPSRPSPLPPPFSSFSASYGGLGVGAPVSVLTAPSGFLSSSLPAVAAVSSSSSTAAPLVSAQRISIVQPRPINLSVSSSAPQQHIPPSSFSSASPSSSSPSHPLPSSVTPRPVCRRLPSNVVLKLTVNLMELFNGINDHYYAAKERKKQEEREARRREREQRESDRTSNSRSQQHGVSTMVSYPPLSSSSAVPRAPSSPVSAFDDRDSNYIVRQHEQLCDGRYVVEQSLGKGSFGRVIQCRDLRAGRSVAVKIIKSKRAFYKQAQVEIRILQSLQAECDRFNIVEMVDSFMHRGHMCIVFELLSINLYELIRNSKSNGVSLILTAKFAYQILTTLAHLSSPARGDKRVIHCDLKPENILLRHRHRSLIKLIDFGSACHVNEKVYTYIQSRFYRAPEVLLGLPYNASIDMWSLGCLLMELVTGHPLFDAADEKEQIVRHYEVFGCPPYEMVHGNSKALQYYECDTGRRAVRLRDKLTARKVSSVQRELGNHYVASDNHCVRFLDLVTHMLTYPPKHRIKPYEALSHPFFEILQQHSSSSSNSGGSRSAVDDSLLSSVEASPVSGPVSITVSLQPSVDVRMSLLDTLPVATATATSSSFLHPSLASTRFTEQADDMMTDDKENDAPITAAAAPPPPLERTQSDLHTRPFVHAPLPRSTSQEELPSSESAYSSSAAAAPAESHILPVKEQKRRGRERSSINDSRNARAALVMSLRSRTKKSAPSPPAVPVFNPFAALQSSPSQPSHEDVSSNDSMNDDTDSPPPTSVATTSQPASSSSRPSRIYTRSQHHRTTSFDGVDSQNELQHLVMTDDGGSDNSPQTATSAACVRRRGSGSLKGKKGGRGKQSTHGRASEGGSKSASSSRPQSPSQSMVVELSERRRTRRSRPRHATNVAADESGYRTPSPARSSYQQSPPTATGMQTRSHKAALASLGTTTHTAIVAMEDDTQTQQAIMAATRSQPSRANSKKKLNSHNSERKATVDPASSHSTRRHPRPHPQPSASSLRSSPRPSHFSNLPPASSNGAASVRRPVTRSSAANGTQQQQPYFDQSHAAAAGAPANGVNMVESADSISQRTRSHITLR